MPSPGRRHPGFSEAAAASSSRRGDSFDAVATDYARHRPAYPDTLVDRACRYAGLGPGSRVLEIGCGTGQLTRSLLARGVHVLAVEPGAHLADIAADSLGHGPTLQIQRARFEDADLPAAPFDAIAAAASVHWIDPAVGWARMADALAPGGSVLLLQHIGLEDPNHPDDQRAVLDAIAAIAPRAAAVWPHYRNLTATIEGARRRRADISAMWSWLGSHDLVHADARRLFGAADLSVEIQTVVQSAATTCAVLGTMSFWADLTVTQQAALRDAVHALQDELGHPLRATLAVCLATARRTSSS